MKYNEILAEAIETQKQLEEMLRKYDHASDNFRLKVLLTQMVDQAKDMVDILHQVEAIDDLGENLMTCLGCHTELDYKYDTVMVDHRTEASYDILLARCPNCDMSWSISKMGIRRL